MAEKRAKTVTKEQLAHLLAHVSETSRMPIRDRLIVLLSHKAGLRSAEIAKIEIKHMTDSEGRIHGFINVYSHVGKKQRERTIPMHPEVKAALKEFMTNYPKAEKVVVSRTKSKPYLTPNALTVWFHRLYQQAGFTGCSSHSGRRSFGTTMARTANNFHASLRDVQVLLGHARLETTEKYIEPSDDVSAMVMAV